MIEILTFLGSYLLSFLSTASAEAAKRKQAHLDNLLKLHVMTEKSTQSARKVTDKHTKTTRRFLAIFSATILIGGLIVLGAFEVPMFIEVKNTVGGWFFMPERTVTEFVPIKGVPVLVEYRLILISIFGLYFGNNHAR